VTPDQERRYSAMRQVADCANSDSDLQSPNWRVLGGRPVRDVLRVELDHKTGDASFVYMVPLDSADGCAATLRIAESLVGILESCMRHV
jgi:hypothetical protein